MLKGKCAVITGSTRGIGKSIAIKYASLGCNIVINYKSENDEVNARELSDEICKLGVDTLIVKANVGDFEEAKNLVEKAKEKFGKVDILVNNAGVARIKPFLEMTDEERKQAAIEVLPESLYDAVRYLNEDKFICDVLGEHITSKYTEAKLREWNDYKTQVTQWELDEYLYKF